jgi:hypothetical protein
MIPSRKLTERTSVHLQAKIVSGDETYHGIIQNVSETGIGSFIESVFKVEEGFTPKKKIKILFQAPSGETIRLDCEIIWYSRESPEDKKLSIGIKIVEPSEQYRQFVQSLKSKRFNKMYDE